MAQADHPFVNRRLRILGLDRGAWIKGGFAVASAMAIVILLSIIGALLKEGYEFIPTNHHRLQTQRLTGGEFANLIGNDLEQHDLTRQALSRALSLQQVSEYEVETGRRQAAFAAFNAFEDVVDKRRERLTIDREAGRRASAQALASEIEEITDDWLGGEAMQRAVAESNNAEVEYLDSPAARFDGPEDQLGLLTKDFALESGLHRFVWLRDPEARELLVTARKRLEEEAAQEARQNQAEAQDDEKARNTLSALQAIQQQARRDDTGTDADAESRLEPDNPEPEASTPAPADTEQPELENAASASPGQAANSPAPQPSQAETTEPQPEQAESEDAEEPASEQAESEDVDSAAAAEATTEDDAVAENNTIPGDDDTVAEDGQTTEENATEKNATEDEGVNVDETLPEGVLALGEQLLVPADRLGEILGDTYIHQDNTPVWIWLGQENGVEAEEAGTPESWALWLWSEDSDSVGILKEAGLGEPDSTDLRTVMTEAFRRWSTSAADKPLLLDGLDGDRAAAAARTGSRYRLERDLLSQFDEAVMNLDAVEELLRLDIIETYAKTKDVALAPEKMIALMRGAAQAIDSGNLDRAYENASSAAELHLIPVAYEQRVQLIYRVQEGIEAGEATAVSDDSTGADQGGNDAARDNDNADFAVAGNEAGEDGKGGSSELLAARLSELATAPLRDFDGSSFSEDYLASVEDASTDLAELWTETNPDQAVSIEAAYADAVSRLKKLRPRILGELEPLASRFEELRQRDDYQALLDADVVATDDKTSLANLDEQLGAALGGDADEQTDAATRARIVGGQLIERIRDLSVEELEVDREAVARLIAELLPLPSFDADAAANEKTLVAERYPELVERFESSPEELGKWRHDEDVSWLGSVWSFFSGRRWVTNNNPWFDMYGMLPLMTGSFMIATIAILLCVPFAVGAAIFVNQFSNKTEMNLIKPAIEFIEALPSVVLGFFGIAVLGDQLQNLSEVGWLSWMPGWPMQERLNAFVAGVLLALMATPTVFTLAEDALNNVPKALVEASESLGASRVQTVFRVLLPASISGIIAAVLLGFGRVIGETMVVLLVAGGSLAMIDFAKGLGAVFEPTHTMTGIIAQEIPEVTSGSEHWAALFMIGVALFFFSLVINVISRWIVNKFQPEL